MSNFKQLISKEFILLDADYKNKEELFEKVSKILYEKNRITETFLEAIKAREEVYPTGLPVMPYGVAIPHTDPCHVIEPCIVAIKPIEPIIFKEMGQGENDIMCKFVFMLVVKNNGEQVELLQKLLSIITDENSMNLLNSSITSDELYETLQSLL